MGSTHKAYEPGLVFGADVAGHVFVGCHTADIRRLPHDAAPVGLIECAAPRAEVSYLSQRP